MTREYVEKTIYDFFGRTSTSRDFGSSIDLVRGVSIGILDRLYEATDRDLGNRKGECIAAGVMYMAQKELAERGYFGPKKYSWFEKNGVGCTTKHIRKAYDFIKEEIGLPLFEMGEASSEVGLLMDLFDGKRVPGEEIPLKWPD